METLIQRKNGQKLLKTERLELVPQPYLGIKTVWIDPDQRFFPVESSLVEKFYLKPAKSCMNEISLQISGFLSPIDDALTSGVSEMHTLGQNCFASFEGGQIVQKSPNDRAWRPIIVWWWMARNININWLPGNYNNVEKDRWDEVIIRQKFLAHSRVMEDYWFCHIITMKCWGINKFFFEILSNISLSNFNLDGKLNELKMEPNLTKHGPKFA